MRLKDWWQSITEKVFFTGQSSRGPSHRVDIPSVSSESGGARILLESPIMLFSNPEQLKNNKVFLHEFTHSYQMSVLYPHFYLNQEMLLFYFLEHLGKLEKSEEGKLKSRSREVRNHFRDLETKLNEFKDFEEDYLFTPGSVAEQGNLSEKDKLRLDFFLEGQALIKDSSNQFLFQEERQKGDISLSQLLDIGDKIKRKWRKSSTLHRESFAFFDNSMEKIMEKGIKEAPRERLIKLLTGGKVFHFKWNFPPYLIWAVYPLIGAAALAPPRIEKVSSKLQRGELPTLKPQLDRLKKLWSEPDNLIDEERLHENLELAQKNIKNWLMLMAALVEYVGEEKTLKQVPMSLKISAFFLPLLSLVFHQYMAHFYSFVFQELAIKEERQEFTLDLKNYPSPHKIEEKFHSKLSNARILSNFEFPNFLRKIGIGRLGNSTPLVTVQDYKNRANQERDYSSLFLSGEQVHQLAEIKSPGTNNEENFHNQSGEDLSSLFFEHFLLVRMAKKAPQMITGENPEGEKIPYPIECPAHELGGNFVERCSQTNFGEDSGKRCKVSRSIEGEFDAEQEFAEETCSFWRVFNQSGMGKINYQWE